MAANQNSPVPVPASVIPRELPGPIEPITCAWRFPHLMWQMTRREILGRYRGSMLGLFWSFVTPLILLAVFTFVFSVIFQARWGRNIENKGEFAVVLFAGLIVFWLLADCASRAPNLVLENTNFVKKIVFPLEILPWTVMISALFHAAVAILVLLLASLLVFGFPPWTVILIPLVLAPFVMLIMGICWFLSSLGVFYRDIGHMMNVVLVVLMYTSPIIYPSTAVPEEWRHLLYLNPLTFIVEQARAVLLWGEMPRWGGLLAYSGLSYIIGWFGYAWFAKTRKGFANVL